MRAWRRRTRALVLTMTLSLCVATSDGRGDSATPYDEALVKAEMIERFCRFVEWPEDVLGSLNEPFVIGLLVEDEVGKHLRNMAKTRRIQRRSMEVRLVTKPNDVLSDHVVWVGAGDRAAIAMVIAMTRGRPILTVGSSAGLAEHGVLINIIPVGTRLAFEVNLAEARSSGLTFSSKLLRLARIVEKEAVWEP